VPDGGARLVPRRYSRIEALGRVGDEFLIDRRMSVDDARRKTLLSEPVQRQLRRHVTPAQRDDEMAAAHERAEQDQDARVVVPTVLPSSELGTPRHRQLCCGNGMYAMRKTNRPIVFGTVVTSQYWEEVKNGLFMQREHRDTDAREPQSVYDRSALHCDAFEAKSAWLLATWQSGTILRNLGRPVLAHGYATRTLVTRDDAPNGSRVVTPDARADSRKEADADANGGAQGNARFGWTLRYIFPMHVDGTYANLDATAERRRGHLIGARENQERCFEHKHWSWAPAYVPHEWTLARYEGEPVPWVDQLSCGRLPDRTVLVQFGLLAPCLEMKTLDGVCKNTPFSATTRTEAYEECDGDWACARPHASPPFSGASLELFRRWVRDGRPANVPRPPLDLWPCYEYLNEHFEDELVLHPDLHRDFGYTDPNDVLLQLITSVCAEGADICGCRVSVEGYRSQDGRWYDGWLGTVARVCAPPVWAATAFGSQDCVDEARCERAGGMFFDVLLDAEPRDAPTYGAFDPHTGVYTIGAKRYHEPLAAEVPPPPPARRGGVSFAPNVAKRALTAVPRVNLVVLRDAVAQPRHWSLRPYSGDQSGRKKRKLGAMIHKHHRGMHVPDDYCCDAKTKKCTSYYPKDVQVRSVMGEKGFLLLARAACDVMVVAWNPWVMLYVPSHCNIDIVVSTERTLFYIFKINNYLTKGAANNKVQLVPEGQQPLGCAGDAVAGTRTHMRDFASVDQVGEYFSVRVLDAPKAYRTFEGGDIFFQFPRCRALAVHMPRCLPSTDVALSQWETYLARPPLASLDDVRVEDFWAQWSCGGARESRADLGASLKHNPPKRDPKWVRCSQVASEQQRIASGRLAGEYVLLYRTADGRAVYWGDDPMALRPTIASDGLAQEPIAPRVYWHRAADDDDASGAVDADGAPTDGDGGGDSGGSSSLLYRLMPVSDRNTDEFYLRLLARHRPTRSHADLLGQDDTPAGACRTFGYLDEEDEAKTVIEQAISCGDGPARLRSLFAQFMHTKCAMCDLIKDPRIQAHLSADQPGGTAAERLQHAIQQLEISLQPYNMTVNKSFPSHLHASPPPTLLDAERAAVDATRAANRALADSPALALDGADGPFEQTAAVLFVLTGEPRCVDDAPTQRDVQVRAPSNALARPDPSHRRPSSLTPPTVEIPTSPLPP
jgi:hypothetical protein